MKKTQVKLLEDQHESNEPSDVKEKKQSPLLNSPYPENKDKTTLKYFARDQRNVEKFCERLDVPHWYRDMSHTQLQSVDKLLHALRDDKEQDTAHRVRDILILMGINPVVSDQRLKMFILFSRGSDIAFLYFLYEFFYKTDDKNEFTINEQLLLTAVAHLDMITTLRGLDEVLPPPQKPKYQLNSENKKKNKKKKVNSKLVEEKMHLLEMQQRHKKFAPYFTYLRRPKPYGHSSVSKRPPFRISLDMYDKWKDKLYIVPNEHNRWFFYFNLLSLKRAPEATVEKAVRISNASNFGGLNQWLPWYATFDLNNDVLPKEIVTAELRDLIQKEIYDKLDMKTKTILCKHHEHMKEIQDTLEQQMKVEARDRCLNYFNVDMKRKDESLKRVLPLLEQDIQRYENEFKERATKIRHHALVHIASSVCNYTKIDHLYECNNNNNNSNANIKCNAEVDETGKCQDISHKMPSNRLVAGMSCDSVENVNTNDNLSCSSHSEHEHKRCRKITVREPIVNPSETYCKRTKNAEILKNLYKNNEKPKRYSNPYISSKYKTPYLVDEWHPAFRFADREKKVHSCREQIFETKPIIHSSCLSSKLKRKQQSQNQDHKVEKKISYVKSNAVYESCRKTESEIRFFTAPSSNAPYKFNYEKIFDIKSCDHNDNGESNTELDEEAEIERDQYEKGLLVKLKSKFEDININEVVNKNWQDMLRKAKIKARNVMEEEELINRIYKNNIRQKYKQNYFDPDDVQLMRDLLKDGLAILRQNQRYVLASMPDAHKIPILREWIYDRYGKVYTDEELQAQFVTSFRVFKAIRNLTLEVPMIKLTELTNEFSVSYNCAHYMQEKLHSHMKKFYSRLNDLLMKHTRLFWFGIHAFLHTSEPLRNVFFSYMPSQVRDISHYNVWKSSEFRDMPHFRKIYRD